MKCNTHHFLPKPRVVCMCVSVVHVYLTILLHLYTGFYSHFDDQEPTSRSGGKPKVMEALKKEKEYKK